MTQRFYLKEVSRFALGIPRWLGENPFFGFLILLFVALLISSAVFYRYVFLLRETDVRSEVMEVRLEQQAFREVILLLQKHGEEFNRVDSGDIRNIFAPPEENQEIEEPPLRLTE